MSRLPTDRRTLLKAGLAAPIALQVDSAAAVSLDLTMFGPGRLFADVQSYAEAGNKQSGGAGDRWTADWTAKRLFSAGFEVDRQTFDVPWFEASHCELTLGDHTIPLVAQPLAVETGEAGLAAPLRLAEIPERLDGAIAVGTDAETTSQAQPADATCRIYQALAARAKTLLHAPRTSADAAWKHVKGLYSASESSIKNWLAALGIDAEKLLRAVGL